MADSFKIELGVELEQGSLANVQTQLNNIQSNPIQLQMDTTRVQNQLNNIRQQIQALGNITINLGGGGNNRGVGNQVTALQRAYREVYNLSKQISSMELKIGKLNMSGVNSGNITQYTAQLNTLRTTYQSLMTSLNGTNVNLDSVFTQIDQSRTQIAQLSSVVDDARTKLASEIKININNGDLQNQIAAIEQKFNSLNVANTNVTNGLSQLRTLLGTMDASDDIESVTNDYQTFRQTLETVTNQVNKLQRAQQNTVNATNLNNQRTALTSQIDIWLKNNSADAKEFGSQMQALRAQIQSADGVQLNNLKAQFQELKRQAELAGTTGLTVLDKIKAQFSKLGVYFSATMLITQWIRALQSMYDNVVSVDTAMTELYRVTDLTATQYNKLYDSMTNSALKYGTTLDGIINSTASWVRLGFDTNDANRLAEITAMYQHVTDLDENTAVNNLVTAYKGYEKQLLELNDNDATAAVEMIADIYDKLGNEFAESAADVGDGLSKSASVLVQGGASIQEAAGMFTGIQEVLQDSSTSGTALKILTLRIRGMKGELEELGEEVDENVDSISKIQTQILNLTSGKVNIFDDEGNFRNIYDIMNDISDIYYELSETDRASLLEIIAGKNRANAVQALIDNWSNVEAATEAAYNSAGTAAEEQEIWMESLEGYLANLTAAWQTFANDFLSSDFLKGAISGLTSLVKLLDKLVNTFGTLGAIGLGNGIFQLLKNGGYFKSLISSLASSSNAFSQFGTAAKMAGTDLLSFLKTPTGVATAIGLVTAAIGIAVQAYKNYKQAQREAWQSQMENGQAAREEAENITNLYNTYQMAKSAYETNAGSKDTLINATSDLLSALGYEGEAVDELAGKYGDLDTAINQVTIDSLTQKLDTLQEGYTGAKNALLDITKDGNWIWEDNYFSSFALMDWMEDTQEFGKKMGKILEDAGLITSSNYNQGGTVYLGDPNTIEGITESYEKLIAMRQALNDAVSEGTLTADELADSSMYQAILSKLDEFENEYQEYEQFVTDMNETQAKINVFDSLNTNGIPKTQAEFDSFRQSIIDASEAGGAFVGTQEQIVSAIDNVIGTTPSLTQFVTGYTDAIADAAELTEEQLEETKSKFANNIIADWFENLDDEDKKFVYEIGLRSDDTTLYTLTRWKTELESMRETGQTTGEQMQTFYDIINDTGDGNFSEYIEGYTENLSSLQDALSKIDTGTLEQSDKVDLALNFPELAPYVNDTDLLRDAIQNLIDTSNQDMNSTIDQMIDNLAESAPEAAAALEAVREAINGLTSASGWDFDIDAEVEKFDNLYAAMKESVSGTGLSTKGIENVKAMFQGLDGYDPSVLFERTEHGIHLNTTALHALQSEYESTKKLDIQERLQDLKQEYNDSAKAVEGLTDAQAKNVLEQKGLRSTDAILADIENVQTLAAQYEGLTSAYNKWIMAQSAGEEGDMYDNVTDSLEDIKKLYDDGLIGTNAFRSAVQMMTNEDLSTANIDKLIATYEAGYPAMKRYFTEGQEGAITFLEDIQNINSEWAHMNEDGTWEINFGVGNDEEIANAISEMTGLQISTEEVQMIMRKLSDYGFDIKLDSAYTSVDELKSRIEETESKLKELGQEPVDININAEGESAQTELDKAKQKIEEIKNSDASIEVKTAQLEDAYAKVDVLVAKVNQPAFMSIDVTQVDSELQGALTTLQEYQTAVNNLNALEIKGADTSEIEAAKGKVDELAGKIQELPDDVKTKIGLETDGSIEDIKSQISNDEVKISVTADTTQATTEIEGIEGESVEVEVITSGNEALDNLKSALEGLEDKDVKITAEVTGLEDVQALSDSVKNVENKEATATVTSVGKDDAVALADAVEKIVDKNATATVTSVGKDDAVALSQAIENVTNKTVTTTVVTEGKDDVDALKASIDSLYDRTVTSTAKVVGTKLVIALKEAIDSLYSKTVSAGANVFGTSAVRSLKSAIDSLYSKTVTATTVTRKVAGVDGTAHAQGTAFVEGDWGAKESGVALGGELGQELIVRDGHFFTIGDDAAEFFKYKKGDIIFNAEQTKQIFEKGKITHGSGRGKAMAEGTAFSSGSGKFTQSGKTVYNSSQAKKGSSSKSSSSKSSGKSSSSSADDFKETFDWIEVAIDRIERAISKLDTKANSVYRTWSERNKNLTSEMTKVSEEINLQQAAYTRYMKQANSVGLSTSWMNKVKNGLVDINTITDETLADKIKEAQEWVDKAKDCQDAILDLQETLSGLYSTAFENVSTQYDGILAVVEHEQSMIEEYISQAEEKGYITSTKYYEALMQSEQEAIAKLQKEKADLTTAMNNAVNSGAIKRGSEEWYNMVQAIDEVTLSIEEGNTALIEYAAAIREIKWEIFDLIEQKISAVTTEAQFLIDLLSSADLYNDKGQLTDEGQSTMGLHAVNYDIYMAQADDYAQEIKKIDAELANDPANEEIAERRQELLELQQEMILAAEDEKEAIVDMVREGIELELDALKDLIDTYTEALDAQKDLYDYQNKIKDQTTEIATLQKQLQAYSGDTSEETKATVQKLKVSLEEAKSNLEDSEYDKYISDQKQLLDELYLDYETTLNMRLDNIDKLISDMITSINSNSGTIASTLYSAADKVGYTMSESMNTIWKEAYASTQSDSQLRVQQATAILNQLVANGQITQYDANQILTALGSGSAAQAEQALSIIQQLVADGSITQSTGNSIIASLNTNSQKAALDALSIVNKLTQNGTLSTADANKIINALVTGDAQDLQNTANIISRLLSNNQIDTQNAATLLTALNGNTAAENQNTLNLINRLIQNSALSTADATKLWTALITGNSQDLANTTSIISRLLTNSQISSAEAANLISTLNGAKAADLQNALSIVNKLTQNGTLSTADANKIINALVTGDAAAVQNAQSIISKLEAQGKISTADATGLKTALNTAMTNAQSANTNIVTTYGKDLGSKLTTVNTSLSNIKASVDAIVAKLNATASTQTAAASSSSAAKAPTPTPAPAAKPATTTTTTTKPATSSSSSSKTTRTTKQKYGVALAIINGNYGWGTGDTRKSRLKAKGFDATEIQNLVNKLIKEGYVNSGKWVGRYQGITSLTAYHYNKFAQGIKGVKKDQLAITQEKGTEYINSPTAGLLTPLTQGSDVFNAAASDNLWNMANNPEQFIQDNLGLDNIIPSTIQNVGGNNFTGDINMEINLEGVTDFEDFIYKFQHDPRVEKMVRAMTVDQMFGGSSLRKYKV